MCECHHGTAYTRMMADYSGIHSAGQSYGVEPLCWRTVPDEEEINVTRYGFTAAGNFRIR